MHKPDFTLMSRRIGFRMLEEDDLQNLVKLDMDPEVRAFFPGGISSPELLREKIEKSRASFLANGFGEFSMTELQTSRFIGRAGFAELESGEIEVGYLLLKEYWGRGLASEALCALLDWAKKSLRVPRILAYAPVEHAASLGVMKKAGMRYLKTEIARGVNCKFFEYPLRTE
jgi:ribosomal-protein-alanine N-acetyltransferase